MAFKRYALRRVDDESRMRLDASRRSNYARRQRAEIYRRWKYSDAVQQPNKYNRLADKFSLRDSKLRRRMSSLRRRISEYHAGIDFFAQRYKEHMTRDKDERRNWMAIMRIQGISSESPSLVPWTEL